MPVNCNVEIICNTEKETNRLAELHKIIEHYKVTPSYTVYGEETQSHKYFSKYRQKLNVSAISLAINHVSILEKYKDSDKPLLIFESDALCLHDFDTTDSELNNVMDLMKKHSIDYVFLGLGCFDDPSGELRLPSTVHITEGLYKTGHSRCTEAYLVSPNGIRRYLDYFYRIEKNHTAMDAEYNIFFDTNPDVIACWLIPELFKQGSRSIYGSLVPVESDTSIYNHLHL